MQLSLGDHQLPRTIAALNPRHQGDCWWLVHGDSLEILDGLPDESFDLIFADPPYQLSNGGTTCRSGERVAVDKGEWDRSQGCERDYAFNERWLRACRRLLRRSGTIWVSGTYHNIFSVGFAMQRLGYHVLNVITWFKPNAAPNLACRFFTHSTELVIWAAPRAIEPLPHVFNYAAMKRSNGGKQMRDMWTLTPPRPSEKEHGEHPTQKPLALLERILLASTNPGAMVLDPFSGSGTTAVAALSCGRKCLGIDLDAGYLDLTASRLAALRNACP